MASAADMLTSAVGEPDAAWTRRYRTLLRRCINGVPEDAPTKWASPPPRKGIPMRQALVLASLQLVAFMCLLRWLGFYEWASPGLVNAVIVATATPIAADVLSRIGRWARRRNAVRSSPRADGRMRYRPILRRGTKPPTR